MSGVNEGRAGSFGPRCVTFGRDDWDGDDGMDGGVDDGRGFDADDGHNARRDGTDDDDVDGTVNADDDDDDDGEPCPPGQGHSSLRLGSRPIQRGPLPPYWSRVAV